MDEYTITIIRMSWNKYLSLVFFNFSSVNDERIKNM